MWAGKMSHHVHMADPRAMCDLWTWCLADRVDAGPVLTAVAAAVGRPVLALGAVTGDDVGDAIGCDVWYTTGDFRTVVDCYFVPASYAELPAAAAVARRLQTACLFADGGLDPDGYLLATPDGVVRAVRATVTEADDGPRWSLAGSADLPVDPGQTAERGAALPDPSRAA